ncbi:MAG: phasin family protein [Candidatus Micrarchaeaceae archaeon]
MADYHKIQFKAKSPDIDTLIEIQRKNIQAFAKINKVAFEGLQAIAERQREIFSQVIGDTSAIVETVSHEETAQGKVARHTDLVQRSYEKNVKHWHELADLIGDSTNEAADILHERVGSSLAEFKSAFAEDKGRKKAA